MSNDSPNRTMQTYQTAAGDLNAAKKSMQRLHSGAPTRTTFQEDGWKPKSGKSRAYRTLASGKHRISSKQPGARNTRNVQSAHPARAGRNRMGHVGMSLRQNAAFQEFRNQRMIVQQSAQDIAQMGANTADQSSAKAISQTTGTAFGAPNATISAVEASQNPLSHVASKRSELLGGVQ